MQHPEDGTFRADAAVAAAVAVALEGGLESPLLEAAELLVAGSVRAALLYPTWAAALSAEAASPAVDMIAQHLVAANMRLAGEIGS